MKQARIALWSPIGAKTPAATALQSKLSLRVAS